MFLHSNDHSAVMAAAETVGVGGLAELVACADGDPVLLVAPERAAALAGSSTGAHGRGMMVVSSRNLGGTVRLQAPTFLPQSSSIARASGPDPSPPPRRCRCNGCWSLRRSAPLRWPWRSWRGCCRPWLSPLRAEQSGVRDCWRRRRPMFSPTRSRPPRHCTRRRRPRCRSMARPMPGWSPSAPRTAVSSISPSWWEGRTSSRAPPAAGHRWCDCIRNASPGTCSVRCAAIAGPSCGAPFYAWRRKGPGCSFTWRRRAAESGW